MDNIIWLIDWVKARKLDIMSIGKIIYFINDLKNISIQTEENKQHIWEDAGMWISRDVWCSIL